MKYKLIIEENDKKSRLAFGFAACRSWISKKVSDFLKLCSEELDFDLRHWSTSFEESWSHEWENFLLFELTNQKMFEQLKSELQEIFVNILNWQSLWRGGRAG